MHLQYNGVNLKIVRLLESLRQDQYDPSGIDYIHSHWRLSVEAIYAPDRTSFGETFVTAGATQPNAFPDPTNPTVGTANSPVYTDLALRHRLMQPQKQLYVWFDSAAPGQQDPRQMWVVAPTDGCPCDPINGPHPIECTVSEVFGAGRTFLVRFSVEFATRDCGWGQKPTPILVSNRFTCRSGHDENYAETRVIEGIAIFRPDLVKRLGAQIQDYIPAIAPPPPANCVRTVDRLDLLPDGATVEYAFRDVQQMVPYCDYPTAPTGTIVGSKPRNVAKISCVVTRQFQQAGAEEVLNTSAGFLRDAMWAISQAAGVIDRVVQGGSSIVVGAATAGVGDADFIGMDKAFGRMAGFGIAVGELTLGLGLATVQSLNAVLPRYTEQVVVRVQGNPAAKKADLQYLAYAVAFGQLTGSDTVIRANPGLFMGQASAAVGTGIVNAVTNAAKPGAPVTQGGTAGGGFIPPFVGAAFGGAIAGGVLGGVAAGAAGKLPAKVAAAAQEAVATIGAVANQALTGVLSVFQLVPPAHTLTLRYDAFDKWVEVEMTQAYSGILDAIAPGYQPGRTFAGRKRMVDPIGEDVIGGDWPSYFNLYEYVVNAAGGILGQQVPALASAWTKTLQLPNLPDKGLLIGTTGIAPAIGPPGDGVSQGTSLAELAVLGLLGECGTPEVPPMVETVTGRGVLPPLLTVGVSVPGPAVNEQAALRNVPATG